MAPPSSSQHLLVRRPATVARDFALLAAAALGIGLLLGLGTLGLALLLG